MQEVEPRPHVPGEGMFWATRCPTCRSLQTFYHDDERVVDLGVKQDPRFVIYHFLACTNCGHSCLGRARTPGNNWKLVREYEHFYPGLRPNIPDGLREEVEGAMAEAAACYSVSAWTAACVMCRRAFELELKAREVEGSTLDGKIEGLAGVVAIPAESLKPAAHAVRILGNSAAHDLDAMTQEDADASLAFCELLFSYISLAGKAEQIRAGKGKPATAAGAPVASADPASTA